MPKELSCKELFRNLNDLTLRNVVQTESGWVVEAKARATDAEEYRDHPCRVSRPQNRSSKTSRRDSPGYKIRMGGDYYQQHKGFGELGIVMIASMFLIFVTPVFQFNSAIKPLLVFAAAP